MLMLQWRQDVEKAADLVNEALEIDDKCDFAYETLATLEVQRYVRIPTRNLPKLVVIETSCFVISASAERSFQLVIKPLKFLYTDLLLLL